jgi:hypothetical protein
MYYVSEYSFFCTIYKFSVSRGFEKQIMQILRILCYNDSLIALTIVVWVWVIIQPTVSRSVYLGIKHPSGAYDQIFITVWSLRVFDMGRPLWREDRSVYYNVQCTVYNIFYCLRFETRFLYLYPPGRGWPGYTPRHWVKTIVSLWYSLYSLEADPQKTPFLLLLRVDSLLQKCVYRTSCVATSAARTAENAACNTWFILAWRNRAQICCGSYIATAAVQRVTA